MADKLRIVLANSSLTGYPEGGGLWTGFLHYLLGLRDLGHDAFWLEVFYTTGDPVRDDRLIAAFFDRMAEFGVRDRCILLRHDRTDTSDLERAQVLGRSRAELEDLAATADVLWNFANALKFPLLALFHRRALLDLDPGLLQVSAQTWDMGQDAHHVFLTIGVKLHAEDCRVPTLGRTWHSYLAPIVLPLWPVQPDPGPGAAISTITQWNWDEIWDDPALSVSKRAAFLRYLDLPRRAARPFQLAANIHPDDRTGDRELLRDHGWDLVQAHDVAGSPAAYRAYIAGARAEISCVKPIFRALRTGWFSERSGCYLASGRPVIAEDTGFGDRYPTGQGLLRFATVDEAADAARAVDADYARHSRAARAFAEEYLDSRRTLPAMLAACA
jgi:hypothetical protein